MLLLVASLGLSPVASATVITCIPASGVVRDVYDNPLSGATVTVIPTGCSGRTATTDAQGRYQVNVPVQAGYSSPASGSPSPNGQPPPHPGVRAQASKAGNAASAHDIYANVGPEPYNDFTLRFELTASLSPSAVQSGDTISIEASTTAPPPSASPAGRVIARLPDGTRLDLVPGVTDPMTGYTPWSGSTTAAENAAEGWYTIEVCAVDAAFTGDCGQAVTIGGSMLLSPLIPVDYIVDNTAPVVGTTYPSRFETILSAQFFGLQWADPGSGLDLVTAVFWLDGAVVTPIVDGSGLVGLSGSSMTPGIHLVEATLADTAGNVASDSFIFALASLDATATTASLPGVTVPVTSTGPLSGKAVFSGVQLDVGSFTATLSASTQVGIARARRQITIGEVEVVFNNGTPLEQRLAVTSPIASSEHELAVIAPSATPLSAALPSGPATVPTFEVNAPPGYTTSGSTARLVPKTVAVDPAPMSPVGTELFEAGFSSQVVVTTAVTVCLEGDPGGSVKSNCTQAPAPTGQVYYAGRPALPLLSPVQGPVDGDLEKSKPPVCVPASAGNGCVDPVPGDPKVDFINSAHSSLVFGCTRYRFSADGTLPEVWRNLCTGTDAPVLSPDGYLGAYVNGWVFHDWGGGFPFFQQDHVDPAEDLCPNEPSGSGRVRGSAYRTAANVQALDGASGGGLIGGAFKRHSDLATDPQVRLGASTRATSASDEIVGIQTSTEADQGYVIAPSGALMVTSLGQNEGYYHVVGGTSIDALRTRLQDPLATANAWDADGVPLANASDKPRTTSRVQLVTGTEFRTPAPDGYALLARLEVQFVADFSGCTA